MDRLTSMKNIHSISFRFLDLVLDVQLHILSFLVTPDLLALALVSRYMNYLTTPSLFSNVEFISRPKPLGSSCSEDVSAGALKSSQNTFAQQLIRHPTYARYVRNLSWQIWGSGRTGSNIFIDVFPLLENVAHLHLINAHPTYLASGISYTRRRNSAATYSQLFPRIKSVKFTGTTSMTLAILPLHSPHLLTTLSLDTINPHSVAIDLLQWVRDSDLSNLRTLSLSTFAPFQGARPCNEVHERQILLCWREAVSAVRNTVETVALGFRDRTTGGREIVPIASSTKIDQALNLVIPVFSEGSWPCLKTLRLEGNQIHTSEVIQHLRDAIPNVRVDTSISVSSQWHPGSF